MKNWSKKWINRTGFFASQALWNKYSDMAMKMKTRKFRRKRCTIILFIMAFFIFIIFVSSYHHTHRLRRIREIQRNKSLKKQRETQSELISLTSLTQDEEQRPVKKREDEVVILLWTKYFGGDLREDKSWRLTNISYPTCFDKCRVLVNKEDVGISDAVIFHSRDIKWV